MPKVVVIARVEDPVKWEQGFRTHGELFRKHTVAKPIHFTTIAGNTAAVCFEPNDMAAFLRSLDTPETAEAMAFDGVKRETVQIFALDREFQP